MQNDRPIFVFGTGRCGSTFVQSALCRTADIWIWGEHDGMLTALMNWGRATREGPGLNQFGFRNVGKDAIELLAGNETHVAWMVPFSKKDIDAAETRLIRELFTLRLPPGKQRWGFKEIRYGANSAVPRRLIALFPQSRTLHVVRNPLKTISSSIRAWNSEAVKALGTEEGAEAAFAAVYAGYVDRWIASTEHLLNVETAAPDHVRTLRIEDADARLVELAGFLGVEEAEIAAGVKTGLKHPAMIQDNQTSVLSEQLEICAARHRERLAPLAQRLGYGDLQISRA